MTARSKLNPKLIYKHPSSTVKASSMDQDTNILSSRYKKSLHSSRSFYENSNQP